MRPRPPKPSLTDVQLESLRLYDRVRSGEITLKQAAALRTVRKSGTGPVKIGAYYRTVEQARDNIRSALLTVLIASSQTWLKAEDVKKLMDMVAKAPPMAGAGEDDPFYRVLTALIQNLVT